MLDPRTLAAMKEVFAGKKCMSCGEPAGKIRNVRGHGQQFFCLRCIELRLNRVVAVRQISDPIHSTRWSRGDN